MHAAHWVTSPDTFQPPPYPHTHAYTRQSPWPSWILRIHHTVALSPASRRRCGEKALSCTRRTGRGLQYTSAVHPLQCNGRVKPAEELNEPN